MFVDNWSCTKKKKREELQAKEKRIKHRKVAMVLLSTLQVKSKCSKILCDRIEEVLAQKEKKKKKRSKLDRTTQPHFVIAFQSWDLEELEVVERSGVPDKWRNLCRVVCVSKFVEYKITSKNPFFISIMDKIFLTPFTSDLFQLPFFLESWGDVRQWIFFRTRGDNGISLIRPKRKKSNIEFRKKTMKPKCVIC